jgi:hypothetical protein
MAARQELKEWKSGYFNAAPFREYRFQADISQANCLSADMKNRRYRTSRSTV